MSAYDILQAARAPQRPTGRDFNSRLTEDFIELHGDRSFGDDGAVIGGIGRVGGEAVTVIALEKGHDTGERVERNFGSAHPEGYRKALRLMKQAEKFHRPILTFIDTPGAYPGMEAEERGQGEAIARNLMEMSRLTVPVVATVTGEGNSGGALALGVADRVLMLSNAVYSILSPEGFATILWKDSSRHEEACELMQLTAPDLKRLGVIDEIIPEPAGGAHLAPEIALRELDAALDRTLKALSRQSGDALAAGRYQKFRQMGTPPKEDQ